jgi:hypothetical protein
MHTSVKIKIADDLMELVYRHARALGYATSTDYLHATMDRAIRLDMDMFGAMDAQADVLDDFRDELSF